MFRVDARVLVLVFSTALFGDGYSQDPSRSAEATAVAGISRTALAAASAELREQVARKVIPGGAHMVARNGKTAHFEVAGVCDIEDETPLKRDTIVRIYSMSKPITSVAAMTLWEKGRFKLDDPVSKFVPAFASTRVLVKKGDDAELVASKRPITVRDVFRHTTGYTYGSRERPELFEHYKKEGMLYDDQHGMFPPKMTIARAADALARIPAVHHPGEKFTYGYNTDLLGRLIEVWSGETLDEYLRKAVFLPLGMVDTGFSVPEAKRGRLASCNTEADGKRAIADKARTSPFHDGFAFLSGGGGLLSTMRDYGRFCQMLLDGGQRQGRRVLQPSTIRLMFTNQLQEAAGDFRFGLGFAIRKVKLGSGETEREENAYYWGGYANTAFQVVPAANLFQVFLRQTIRTKNSPAGKLFPLVYRGVQ